jgi:hypothetical protein
MTFLPGLFLIGTCFHCQESALHSPDDHPTALTTLKRPASPRRAISKKDYRLPRPYQRNSFSDEPRRLSRMQMSVLAFALLMAATLLALLALFANEDAHSTDGKLIVEADSVPPAPTQPVQPVHLHVARPAGRKPAAAPRALPVVAKKSVLAPRPGKVRLAPAAAPAIEPAADPDVELIAAILMLTPSPPPACLATTPGENHCQDAAAP